jgi:hypothetical protein
VEAYRLVERGERREEEACSKERMSQSALDIERVDMIRWIWY